MAEFLDIGAGNLVNPMRLIAVVSADSSPVRRMIQDARERSVLIDATSGKKTQATLVMDSDHIVCSALRPEEISKRVAALAELKATSTQTDGEGEVKA